MLILDQTDFYKRLGEEVVIRLQHEFSMKSFHANLIFFDRVLTGRSGKCSRFSSAELWHRMRFGFVMS